MTFHLFSHKYKKISGLLYIISLTGLAGLLVIDVFADDLGNRIISFFNANRNDVFKPNIFYDLFFDEALMLVNISSGLLYAFSKEKIENEVTVSIRYKSLIWSFIINYLLLLLLYLTIYGVPVYVLISVFIITQLFIFIAHFRLAAHNAAK
jgi:hypothetical protein